MKIKGYTLHGDYYLADEVVTNVTWKKACKMKEVITLLNGKKIIAHTLSKEELKTISQEEMGMKDYWYWTSSTPGDDGPYAWYVSNIGGFYSLGFNYSNDVGGARLGFHKNEIKQFLDIE